MKEIKIKKGSVIFAQGEPGDAMYAVKEGVVGIYVNYKEKNEKCLVELSAGKFFGEMTVIEREKRSATAVALENTVLVEYTAVTLKAFVTENPDIASELLLNLSGRLRGLTVDYMEAVRTIAEIAQSPEGKKELEKIQGEKVEEGKPAKKGLWQRIKRFAELYSESMETYANTVSTNAYMYTSMNNPYFF